MDVGKAGVETAVSKVESAKLNLGYCDVKAPISGLIGAKQVSIGDLVGKGEPTLLATISTLDPIWFYCTVSEVEYIKAETKSRKLGKKIEDLPLTLILAGDEEHPGKGKFVFIDRAVDAKTGTLRLRVEFPNEDKILRPGMFARVLVNLSTLKDSIQVPERSLVELVELQGRNFVWLVGADGITNQRPITLGDQVGPNFIVTGGLKVGDHIIVEGVQKAREGAKVNPMTAAQIAAMQSSATPAEAPFKK